LVVEPRVDAHQGLQQASSIQASFVAEY
jgi:hypothetical protein